MDTACPPGHEQLYIDRRIARVRCCAVNVVRLSKGLLVRIVWRLGEEWLLLSGWRYIKAMFC